MRGRPFGTDDRVAVRSDSGDGSERTSDWRRARSGNVDEIGASLVKGHESNAEAKRRADKTTVRGKAKLL